MSKYFNIIQNLKYIFSTILFLSCITLLSNVNASYKIDEYEINAVVKNNGNMVVEELLKYNFDDSANGVYRDLLYKYEYSGQNSSMEQTSSRYQANSIVNIKAYYSDNSFVNMNEAVLEDENKLSNGVTGFFSISDMLDNGYRKKIKLYTPASEDSYKYIKYTYEIEDVAVEYDDAGEIYWNFLGADWQCGINNLKINIGFENEIDMSSVKVFPHSYILGLNYNVNDKTICITADHVSEGKAVDARVVFPKVGLNFATKKVNLHYDYAMLESIENKMEFDKNRYILSNFIYVIIAIFAVITLIIRFIRANKISSKGKIKSSKLEIYTEVLDKYSVNFYSVLKNMDLGYHNSKIILATILDLVNRKYILMDAKKKLKKKAFSNIEYDYFMKLNVSKNYSTLDEYEINLLNYLFNGKIGLNVDISEFKYQEFELNDRLEKLAKNSTATMEYEKYCIKKGKDETNKIYNKVPKKFIKQSLILVLCVFILLFVNSFIISPLQIGLKMSSSVFCIFATLFYGMFMAIATSTARSVKEEYIDDYNKLLGLEKYLKEYSLLKDRYPIELVLWEKYLVFACLFGIADKVAKEFKEELIANGYGDDYIYMTYPILNMSINSTSIASSFAVATGSSSSGGYSGGGSGGGGGRRWPVAVPFKI